MNAPRFPVAKPDLGEREWRAAQEVIASGWVTQGPKVAEFERAMADYCGAAHAVAVSSCTAALHLSLLCAGVGPGDEVVVPSMSFIATANAVVHAGARPVFAEVHDDTFNLDADDVKRRITSRTRAVVLVDQLGLPADREAFVALAEEHSLSLVEDAACAVGSARGGTRVGAEGEFVCFSFHPRKVLTTGDGGMILTASATHAERLRRLRQHGMSVSDVDRHEAGTYVRERYVEIGFNYRMTDIQASVGIEQLRRLPDILTARRRCARVYDAALQGHPIIATPPVSPDVEWNVQSYAVRLRAFDEHRRDAVIRELMGKGIATRPGVMTVHREPAYAHVHTSLPVSERASDSSLILPLHTGMTNDDCEFVAATLVAAIERVQADEASVPDSVR